MKHDKDECNITQFESKINLLVNRKKLHVYFLLLSF